ncbi:MAG: hypothetical protein V3T24_03900 [Longimicrobiales bacterium]
MHDRPPLPQGCPRQFRATVHGTVFAGRDRHIDHMSAGDTLYLIPDPPGQKEPEVWVHVAGGDPIGHLPPEIGSWLAPWILQGGGASARALKVHGADVPSWRRVLLEVSCAG